LFIYNHLLSRSGQLQKQIEENADKREQLSIDLEKKAIEMYNDEKYEEALEHYLRLLGVEESANVNGECLGDSWHCVSQCYFNLDR
jgi:hypothetical protein